MTKSDYAIKKKIESKVRSGLSRLYQFGGAHEDADFGRALIASKTYREIAFELRKALFPVLGVWQTREYTGSLLVDCSSVPLGTIYLPQSEMGIVSDYVAQFMPQLELNRRMPQTQNRQEYLDSKSKEALCITSETPPKEGLPLLIEKLKQKLEEPFVRCGKTRIRIT